MTDVPCTEHPTAPVIGGVCGACAIHARIGCFSVELLGPGPGEGCRSTVHCANYGFCPRCSPELTQASAFVLKALAEVGLQWDGEVYGQVMDVLKSAVSETTRGS